MNTTRREGPISLDWRDLTRAILRHGADHLDGDRVDVRASLLDYLTSPSNQVRGWVVSELTITPAGATWYWDIPIHAAPPAAIPPATRSEGDHSLCHACSLPLPMPTSDFMCPNCRRAEHAREHEQRCQDAGEYSKGL